jgi:hypothetical protein
MNFMGFIKRGEFLDCLIFYRLLKNPGVIASNFRTYKLMNCVHNIIFDSSLFS